MKLKFIVNINATFQANIEENHMDSCDNKAIETKNIKSIKNEANLIEKDSKVEVLQLDADLVLEKSRRYLAAARAANTRYAYQNDVDHFRYQWGGVLPCSVKEVLAYLSDQAERLSPDTLSRRVTALSQWHQVMNCEDPTKHSLVQEFLKGLRRESPKAQPKRKAAPLQREQIHSMVDHLNQQNTLSNLRDKALILIGFYSGFRASELVGDRKRTSDNSEEALQFKGIKVEHLQFSDKGVSIFKPRSKTSVSRDGKGVAIPCQKETAYCPVSALQAWLAAANIEEGFIFRRVFKEKQVGDKPLHVDTVSRILKNLAEEIGLSDWQKVSSHSLRRGISTELAQAGTALQDIMRHVGWRDPRTALGYMEVGRQFEDNPITKHFHDKDGV